MGLFDKLIKKNKGETYEELELNPQEIEIADIIAPALIEVKQSYLSLGERLAKSFFVFSYPRYLSTGWLSPVINVNTPLDVSMHIHPADSGEILRKLRKKITDVQAEIAEREDKGYVRDPALETAYEDIERLRDELQTARERVFRLGLYITIYADTDKQLREVETLMRSMLEGRLIYIKPALIREKEGFISTMPYALDQLMVHTPMNTAPLSSVFPFVSPDLSANEGILYGLNLHNNSLVLFDRFSLENANLTIFAKSGSGKSLVKDESILYKQKGKIKMGKIGPVIEEIINERGIDFHDEELEGKILPGIQVWTFNEKMQGSWGEVKIAARKEAPDVFYKFQTQSGRQITTTADHNLVALKQGKIELLRGDAVKKGDFIPLPRAIKVNQLDKDEKIIEKDIQINSQEFLRLAGLITAEGTVLDKKVMISNTENEVLSYLENDLSALKVKFTRMKSKHGEIKGVYTGLSNFTSLVKELGSKAKSAEKRAWPYVFSLPKEQIAFYLAGYFEGDGGVEPQRVQITAVSKSKDLISDIAYLLYSFGIVARIHQTKKIATNTRWKNKKTYWRLSISGQDNLKKFAKEINFISQRKRESLKGILNKTGNTNVDFIPGVDLIFKEIYDLFSCGLYRIQDISNLKRGHFRPSPQKIEEMVALVEQRIEQFKNKAFTYRALASLPSLVDIINLGKNDKALNKKLWQELGKSWHVVKNKEVSPGFKNAAKMIEIVFGNNYDLQELKETIHTGFKETGSEIKYFNKSLQAALVASKESNTDYTMIQQAASHIWQKYQSILLENIPQVEKRLEQLKVLARSDLFWDPIVKIQKQKNKTDEYVYDLTCENNVFLAGKNGMFVHNSYFVKLEVLRYLMQGVGVIVIDPENEYQYLSEAVGGSYFRISLNSATHLNPFDLPLPREDEDPADILRGNVINLVGLIRVMLGGLSPEEDAIIDQALTEVYAMKDITPKSDPANWQERIPIMADFETVLSGMERTESLVERLRKFTRGSYAEFFNNRSNIEMSNDFIVFGIRDMEDDLRPMAMFIILRYIWNQVRSSLKKRILLVDEAWWIMQEEDGASFLYGICKRARKYWLGVTTVTQDVSDFMKSEYGKPIITNSSLQFLLKQSSAAIDLMQQVFNLTEQEKMTLLQCEVGEGIFIAGQKRVALKAIASYTEDQFITSSPEEIQKIKEAKRKLKEEQQGIV